MKGKLMKADGSDVNKALDKQKKQETIFDLVKRMEPAIKNALPNTGITAQRMARIVTTALRINPKLAKCTSISLLGCIMQAAQLGLEINSPLGQAYLVPFWNNKIQKSEAVFILGYQGLIDLCYRSGFYAIIDAKPVYKNDEFNYEFGSNPKLVHKPADKPEGEPVKYYAVYRTKENFSHFFIMSHDQIMEHAKKYSKSWDSQKNCFKDGSAWLISFPYMAMKTVIKGLLKFAKKSADLDKAINIDESVNTAHVEKIGTEDNIIIQSDYEIQDNQNDEKQMNSVDQRSIEFHRNKLKELLESMPQREKENGLNWLEYNPNSKILDTLIEKIQTIETFLKNK